MADSEGSGGFFWFLAGLGIGVAGAILFAPKKGDEVRQQLQDAAGKGRDALKKRAQQATEQARTWADKGREYVAHQSDQIRSSYDAGRQASGQASSEETGTGPDS